MEITTRDFLTVLHGMAFAALFMLAFSGALLELYRLSTPGPAPIAMTMVAYVTLKYGRSIVQHRNMRVAILGFTVAAFVATGIAGAFGAFLNKYAPIRGGSAIILMQGEE